MKEWLGALGLFLLMAVVPGVVGAATPAPAAAQETPDPFTITLPFEIIEGTPGSEHLLWTGDLPPGVCTIIAVEGANNTSVHPDNDLRVSDGLTTVWLRDVERAPGVSTVADGPIEAAGPVDVTLILGPHGLYSADLVLQVDCGTLPETTTTTETPPSTTTTTTTTTTAPPVTFTTTPTTTTTVPVTSTTLPPETTTTTTGSPPTTVTVTTLIVDPPPTPPPVCTDEDGVEHPDVDGDNIDDDTGEICALADTGLELDTIALYGLAVLGLGGLLVGYATGRIRLEAGVGR